MSENIWLLLQNVTNKLKILTCYVRVFLLEISVILHMYTCFMRIIYV